MMMIWWWNFSNNGSFSLNTHFVMMHHPSIMNHIEWFSDACKCRMEFLNWCMSIWRSTYWHFYTLRGQSKCGVKSVAKLSADILFFPSRLAVTCSNCRTSFNKTRFSVGSSRSNSCNALSRRISLFWPPGWSDEPDVPPHISATTKYEKIQTTFEKLGNKRSDPKNFIPNPI